MSASSVPVSVLNWDRQVGLFGKYFTHHANLPRHEFSLLDAGCGTGAALEHIRRRRPASRLFGCDLILEHAVIARSLHGSCGRFFSCDLVRPAGNFDLCLVSNVLEHLTAWEGVVESLLAVCVRLYVMVPYREVLTAEKAAGSVGVEHVNSFDRDSFRRFAARSGLSLHQRVIRTPGAWGHWMGREAILRLRAVGAKEGFVVQRQLLCSLTRPEAGKQALPKRPFVTPTTAWVRALADSSGSRSRHE